MFCDNRLINYHLSFLCYIQLITLNWDLLFFFEFHTVSFINKGFKCWEYHSNSSVQLKNISLSKMKTCLLFVVLFAAIYISSAQLMQSLPSTHKGNFWFVWHNIGNNFKNVNFMKNHLWSILLLDFPNQCYVRSLKKGFSVGEHTPAGSCQKIICSRDFSYEIQGYVSLIKLEFWNFQKWENSIC